MDVEREHARWTEVEAHHWFVRARLRLTPTHEGGRQGPIASGYRSCWALSSTGHADWHDGPLTIEDGQGMWLEPGGVAIVRLHPLVPDLWPEVAPGVELTMHEGSRVVGRAEVLEVVHPEEK